MEHYNKHKYLGVPKNSGGDLLFSYKNYLKKSCFLMK